MTNKPKNVTIELISDFLPVKWSHHYAENGHAGLSIVGGALAGNVDAYWPVLKTITMTLWKTGSGDMTSDQDNDGSGTGMTHIEETEPGIVQAAAHGIFGLEPRFGDNLMRIRPNLPSHWDRAAISNPDVGYSLRMIERNDGLPGLKYTVNVTFARIAREVQLELSIRGAIAQATVNGVASTRFSLEGDKVNGERVRLRSISVAAAAGRRSGFRDPPQGRAL